MFTFTDRHGRSLEELAKRISRMLFDADGSVFYDQDSDKYQIGGGNDYWLRRQPGGEFRFSFRCQTAERVAALKFMLENHVHVQICEEDARAS